MPKKQNPLTKRQQTNLRDKLKMQAGNLVTRLAKNAAGTLTNPQGEPIQMTSGQIKSAEIILSRVIPTLQSIDSTQTVIHTKSKQELTEEGKLFLMASGMAEEEAIEALKRITRQAMH